MLSLYLMIDYIYGSTSFGELILGSMMNPSRTNNECYNVFVAVAWISIRVHINPNSIKSQEDRDLCL